MIGLFMHKILIVDDCTSTRQIVSATLKGVGFNIVEALDGAEALELAKGQRCDLVLSDLNMPNMNGIELVTALRKMDSYSIIPVLLLTTEDCKDKIEESRLAGATGWLNKPFSPRVLQKTVRKVLNISD